jgi:aldehyde:ferredoxin oxidoreductase
MRVSEERIEELRRLYKEAYGQELSEEEARDMALRLVELYRLLMRPLP